MRTGRLPSSLVYKEESKLLQKVIEWLQPQEREGIKVLRICDRYHRGYSDLFICVKGIFVCAELKDDEGVASQHQELFLSEMSAAGAICGVCKSVAEVAALVEEALWRAHECTN